jgi:hypothetical protein
MTRLEAGTDVAGFIREWATSAELLALVAEFGGPALDPSWPTEELLDALDDASSVWDYRARKERNQMVEQDFSAARRDLVHETTLALGLQDTAPPARAHYDHVLILGGLTRGCLARPRTAAGLIASGMLATGDVTGLSAFRPVNFGERVLLRKFDLLDAQTEFDVMDFGLRAAFGVSEAPEVHGASGIDETERWQVHRYGSELPLQVVAAPSREPGRRANTGDTYVWFAEHWASLAPGESLLIVTTYHYRLYQLADAIRLLGVPYGVQVDAIGMAPTDIDPRLAWEASPTALLQELRSSIRSLRRLHRILAG